MKSLSYSHIGLPKLSICTALLALIVCAASLTRASDQPGSQANPNGEAVDVIVRGRLGGLIFGFEIDPNGME